MKIRLGFVSNSSSSSFIIKYSDGEKCLHCGNWIKKPDWEEFFDKIAKYDLRTQMISADNNFIKNEIRCLEIPEEEKNFLISEVENAVSNKLKIAHVRIDNGYLDDFYKFFNNKIIVFGEELFGG